MTEHAYLHNLNLLIIDDSGFMRELLREVLLHFGVHEVREAADGVEALELMRTWAPDIALVDWEMKPLDGIDFVRTIRHSQRSDERFLPIIMVSGHSEYWRIQKARQSGVNEFLVKPLSPQSLFSRIRAIIERPRPFIKAPGYFGPDRRRQDLAHGAERRADMRDVKPISANQLMEQEHINSIFNPGSQHPDDQWQEDKQEEAAHAS